MLIFLKVPNFDCVYKWRLLQEKKLIEANAKSAKTLFIAILFYIYDSCKIILFIMSTNLLRSVLDKGFIFAVRRPLKNDHRHHSLISTLL